MAKRNSQLTELLIVAQDDYLTIVDTSAGQSKRVSVKNLTGLPDVGWTATGESWSFSSWTSATSIGVITVPTDATTKYSVGMYIRITQATGGTKYGRILSLTATTLSVWMPGYTLNNETISSPVYSPLAAPFGIPAGLRSSTPYKFSAYRNGAQNSINGFTKVLAETELYDTNSNYDAATNRRFTAPVAGYYHFSAAVAMVAAATSVWQSNLYKNGVLVKSGTLQNVSTNYQASQVSGDIYLAAGDYVELWLYANAAVAIGTGAVSTYLDGHLATEL